jgi:hypothetical protein
MNNGDGPQVYVTDAEVQTILEACRVLAAISGRSATAGQRVDPADLRILLAIAYRRSVPACDLAMAAEVPTGSVERRAELLASGGLIACRGDGSAARLELTADGFALVVAMIGRRRDALDAIASRLPLLRRLELFAILGRLDTGPAGGQPPATQQADTRTRAIN